MITPAAGSNASSLDYFAYLDIRLGAHLAHFVRTAAGLLGDPLMLLNLLDGGSLRRIRLQHLPAGAREGHAVVSTIPGRTQEWEDKSAETSQMWWLQSACIAQPDKRLCAPDAQRCNLQTSDSSDNIKAKAMCSE